MNGATSQARSSGPRSGIERGEAGQGDAERAEGGAKRSALLLRLASGDTEAAADVVGWPSLLALAARERLAVLAWLRSGESIRRNAHPETVRRWRSAWADATRRGEALLKEYGDASDLLARHAIPVVTLKGAPLALSLYGDATARCSDDVDCYVALEHRREAGELLRGAGWTSVAGSPPHDETFCRQVDGGDTVRLEVHSRLVGERLAHLPLPAPTSVARRVAGRNVLVHDGPLLPAYLAVHLATHFAPPLLWWLDLHSLWSRIDEGERRATRSAAREAGLARYLEWAVRGVGHVAAALGGDAGALRSIGVDDGGRSDSHELWRHVTLAPNGRAALRVMQAWARPSWVAARGGNPLLDCVDRATRHWRVLLPGRRA